MITKIIKLFFDNRNLKQIIFKNIFWLASAQLFTSLLRMLLTVYAVRILGIHEYGKFAFAYSFVSLFAIFNDLGLSDLMIRELSIKKEKEKEYSIIISLKILLGLFCTLAAFIGSFFVSPYYGLRGVVWVLALFIFVENLLNIVYPLIRVRQKMEYEAAIKIAQTFLTFVVGIIMLLNFPSAVNLGFAYFISALTILILTALFLHLFLFFLRIRLDFRVFKRILSESWPLTFGFVGLWTYVNLDSAMIGFLRNSSEVGWFNAASRIILAIVLVVASLISRSFFPMLSNFLKDSKDRLQKIWNYYVGLMILISFPMIVVGTIFSGKIIGFLYGSGDFVFAVFPFQCLIILAGISLLYYPYSMILVVFGHQKKNFLILLLGFLVNIFLNFILIKPFGFNVVAINSILATVVSFTVLILVSKKCVQVDILNKNILIIFLLCFFSGLVAFVLAKFTPIYRLNLFFSIPASLLIYIILLLTLRIRKYFSFSKA